jgi:hypothetical protein
MPGTTSVWIRSTLIMLMLLSSVGSVSWGRPLSPEAAPEPLKPWVPWVLHQHPDHRCPFLFNSSAERHCAWPNTLTLDLTGSQGMFRQQWTLFTESLVPLPGDHTAWPQDVVEGTRPVIVVEKEHLPYATLPAGTHTISGGFSWSRLPEQVHIPPATGLVHLTVNHQTVPFPRLDRHGQLWMQQQPTTAGAGVTNTLDVQVFRRISDDIPFQVLTRVQLDVGGEAREVLLGQALLPSFIPLSLTSPLPTRLEPDGRLRIQVRPGRWTVDLLARAADRVQVLTLPNPGTPWSASELWSVETKPQLRLVELSGLETVDPLATNLPAEWRALPAFRIVPQQALRFTEKRRGDADPNPDQLQLSRSYWLDFSGAGYTIQDIITGTVNTTWRLEMLPGSHLGQVTIDQEPQFITRLTSDGPDGIEVRRGQIHLTADSRFTDTNTTLPAIGWAHPIHKLSSTLHLPPGWSVFHARGPDSTSNTWITQWSLLDCFIVLMIVVTIAKLISYPAGAVALGALVLTYHEPNAPHFLWIHLLAATALTQVLPRGKFYHLAMAYRAVSLSFLLLTLVPFGVQQIRTGLYPTLLYPWETVQLPSRTAAMKPAAAPSAEPVQRYDQLAAKEESVSSSEPYSGVHGKMSYRPQQESGVRLQTGPGLPVWQFADVYFLWNGPVQTDERLTLWLISPGMKLWINILEISLVFILVIQLSGLTPRGRQTWMQWRDSWRGGAMVSLLLLASLVTPQLAHAGTYPPESLLKDLESRLLEPPTCLPACASISTMHLSATPAQLRLRLSVQTQVATAIPLPGHADHWTPTQISLDGRDSPALSRDTLGTLWAQLPAGSHQLILTGPIAKRTTIQVALPLIPHRTTIDAAAWKIDGVQDNGTTDTQLHLTAISREAGQPRSTALESATLPSFLRIDRMFTFDLTWRVTTVVTRTSPVGSGIIAEIPLMPGEVVTSELHVKNQKVLVSLSPQQQTVQWDSLLTQQPLLTLTALPQSHWIEVWHLQISPLWHPTLTGLPAIHQSAASGQFAPEYRPWPGEQLTIALAKPTGAEGPTLTIDHSQLIVTPGHRATDTTLTFSIRSSQGGQHAVTLPEGVTLTQVLIDGTSYPLQLEDRVVRLPIHPGSQQIVLTWQAPVGIEARYLTPAVTLGIPSVNSFLNLSLPHDRWLMFVQGPFIGPAVLIWGLLVTLIALAYALSRISITPLRMTHWALLGLGLTQVPVYVSFVVIVWLLALGARQSVKPDLMKPWHFNILQLGLGALTVMALGDLFWAIRQGLLGDPNMSVAGNGSHAYLLKWYQDQSGETLPQATVTSVSILWYRAIMLAWSIWLALALTRWLKWGYTCFVAEGYWKPLKPTLSTPGMALAPGNNSKD